MGKAYEKIVAMSHSPEKGETYPDVLPKVAAVTNALRLRSDRANFLVLPGDVKAEEYNEARAFACRIRSAARMNL